MLNKRFLMLALAAMAAAAFVVPASASAAQGSCAFTGLAGNIQPGVMLVGGAGEYEFSGTGQCVLNGVAAPNAQILSRGDFRNDICGTGIAFSNDPGHPPVDASDDTTTIDDPSTPGTDITSASYHIDFRATQGTLEVHKINGVNETQSPNGHVAITPAPGESCTDTTGVNAFNVTGALHAVW
jgi:hypothetical protein